MHPDVWLRRRVAIPGREPWELPTMSEEKIRAAGLPVSSRRASHRRSWAAASWSRARSSARRSSNTACPVHEAFRDGEWQADPLLHDDQALVANVRGKGLVVITGCSHAGVINTVRYARKITGVDRVHAVLGGFHLAGPLYEHIDSGDRGGAARHRTRRGSRRATARGGAPSMPWRMRFPNGFIPSSVGTRYVLDAGGSEFPDLEGFYFWIRTSPSVASPGDVGSTLGV